ncbi:MAG: dethiobiotin synthase [Candidatus Riflebacteria bacterium]|nr:dethiobiotin synthase [Candidatus Riflebacteria bacterium]
MSIFVTGIDTGAGKTIVCRTLAKFMRNCGIDVVSQKWIQTGCERDDDLAEHGLEFNEKPISAEKLASLRCPYKLKFPASPHLAAFLENISIDISVIEQSYLTLKEMYDFVIVEGSGGVLVPVTENVLLIDIVQKLAIPSVIVVQNKLGCINHTLLTIEALRSRGMEIAGLIYNNFPSHAPEVGERTSSPTAMKSDGASRDEGVILRDNINIISKITKVPVLGQIKEIGTYEDLSSQFQSIGENLLRQVRQKK